MSQNSTDPPSDGTTPLPELSAEQPTNARWLILGLACSASFLTYLHRYSWGATKPFFKEEYGLSDGEMGWLDGAFNLTYALGQYPGGWMGDAFGPRMVIPIAVVLWSIVMIGTVFMLSASEPGRSLHKNVLLLDADHLRHRNVAVNQVISGAWPSLAWKWRLVVDGPDLSRATLCKEAPLEGRPQRGQRLLQSDPRGRLPKGLVSA